MSTQITSFDITPILIQGGYGLPNHLSSLGTEYTDLYTGLKYVNKDGILGWVQMLDITYPFSGGTSGLSTTTLQQAYNNSTSPEIVINATLDGLSIQNGTGNADNTTHLIQGLNTAGDTTSFIRADGYISGTTIQTNSFLSNSTGVTQSSGFTILSNLSTLNAANDAGAAGLGVPLYGLYRNGNVVQIRIV